MPASESKFYTKSYDRGFRCLIQLHSSTIVLFCINYDAFLNNMCISVSCCINRISKIQREIKDGLEFIFFHQTLYTPAPHDRRLHQILNLSEYGVNNGSGNGLAPSGTKPLPEPMLTYLSTWIPINSRSRDDSPADDPLSEYIRTTSPSLQSISDARLYALRSWTNPPDSCWKIMMTSWHGHDDVIKWKHFPRYWPFVRGIHRSPVNSPHKGQWRGALMFSLICAWINDWVK